MRFFDIRHLKFSNAVFVSHQKKYFETKYPPLFRHRIWKALQRKWLEEAQTCPGLLNAIKCAIRCALYLGTSYSASYGTTATRQAFNFTLTPVYYWLTEISSRVRRKKYDICRLLLTWHLPDFNFRRTSNSRWTRCRQTLSSRHARPCC